MLLRVFVITVLCLLPLFSNAKTLQGLDRYATHETVAEIAHDQNVQAELRRLLGIDYENFIANLQNWAAPAKLRDGGLFVEGWQTNAYRAKTSVFIAYPDGRIYAAYIGENSGILRYYTNAHDYTNELPPALKVWYRIMEHPVNILYMSIVQNPHSSMLQQVEPFEESMFYALSPEDQDEMRSVAASIWNSNLANGWEMNEDVGNVLSQATDAIMMCSAAFSMVPKPPSVTSPGWFWIINNSLSIVTYVIGVSGNQTYKICVNTAALNYRTAIELASMGI